MSNFSHEVVTDATNSYIIYEVLIKGEKKGKVIGISVKVIMLLSDNFPKNLVVSKYKYVHSFKQSHYVSALSLSLNYSAAAGVVKNVTQSLAVNLLLQAEGGNWEIISLHAFAEDEPNRKIKVFEDDTLSLPTDLAWKTEFSR